MHDVVVIGAGNGGLTAAAALAQKGLDVLVLERHNVPGGCATSFVRGRFEFEVALHQLSGLGPAEKPGPLRGLLGKLGVLEKLDFIPIPDLYRVVIPGVLDLTLKPSREAAVAELQKAFPREKEAIGRFFELMYAVFSEVIGVFYMQDPKAGQGTYPLYFKYALKTAQEVLDEFFKDPLLKTAISPYWTYIGLPPRHLSFTILCAMFFAYLEFGPYHLKGGSQAMSSALADSILRHGGTIRYNLGAKKILVKDGVVRGVVTDEGEEIFARAVISNASKVATFVEMIAPDEVPEPVLKELRQSSIGQSAFTIYMGLDCEPLEVGVFESTTFILSQADPDFVYERMKVRDIDENDAMVLSSFDTMDPGFSPPGASQMALVTLKYGEPWMNVPPEEYAAEKYRVAEGMMGVLDRVHPKIRGRIEEMEIATPLTHMRYLGTPRGSVYGFDHYLKDSELFIPAQAPVKGLFGAGGWIGYNGFQPTLESGVQAARLAVRYLK